MTGSHSGHVTIVENLLLQQLLASDSTSSLSVSLFWYTIIQEYFITLILYVLQFLMK